MGDATCRAIRGLKTKEATIKANAVDVSFDDFRRDINAFCQELDEFRAGIP